jgi:hypothetical protein
MRLKLILPLLSALFPVSVLSSPCTMVFANANVWSGKAFVSQTLAMRDGMFVPATTDMPRFDAKGLYFIPPFADGHTHNIDTPSDGASNKFHKMAIAQGVFYALNPNNLRPAGPTRKAVKGLVEFEASGGGITRPGGHPEPLYTWMANRGWLGSLTAKELEGRAFHHATTAAEAKKAVRKVKDNGARFVKLYLLNHDSAQSGGLSAEVFAVAAAEAKKLGLRPIVHIENAADFRLAVKSAVHAIVHVPYQLPDGSSSTATLLIAPEDAKAAAMADIIVVPTTTVVLARYDGAQLAAMQSVQKRNLAVLRDAGVKLAVGADSFSLTMHDEITTLRSFALFEGADMLNMATSHGTSLVFPGRKLGRLAAGYEASFISYFFNPIGNWASLREPVLGVRAGEVMMDSNNLLAKICTPTTELPR